MTGPVSARTAELALHALVTAVARTAARRNGLPLPADIRLAVVELQAASSVTGTEMDLPARPVPTYESVADTAARLGITERAVRKRCAAGALPAERAGRAWLIRRDGGPVSAPEVVTPPVAAAPPARVRYRVISSYVTYRRSGATSAESARLAAAGLPTDWVLSSAYKSPGVLDLAGAHPEDVARLLRKGMIVEVTPDA